MAIPPDHISPGAGGSSRRAGLLPASWPADVRVLRALRPARCPDCLRPAAVGHQCVECIRSGNAGVRRATGRFGGRVAAKAQVTWTLIA